MAEREAVSGLRPVRQAELERAAALVGERLGPKLPFGVAWGRAFARAALDKGRGLTDGSAGALLDPPGAATPVSLRAIVAGLGAPALVTCGLAATLPDAFLVPAGVALLCLVGVLGAAASPERRWRRRARRQGDAWLYGVAKPAGDPPRSAAPLLEGLARYLDHEGWACSLVTTVPALVPRYEAFGFVVAARHHRIVCMHRPGRSQDVPHSSTSPRATPAEGLCCVEPPNRCHVTTVDGPTSAEST